MKKIEIEVPQGHTARQMASSNGITIVFEKEPEKVDHRDIKVFMDAFERADGATTKEYLDSVGPNTPDHIRAHAELILIARVVNNGWKPNWDNGSEAKWFPWFRLSGGFAFDHSDYGYTITYSGVGSRLCFKSRELSDYAAKHFIQLYKSYLR